MKKILLIAFVALIFTGCNKSETYEKNMFYMDTYINIKINTKNKNLAQDGFSKAEEIYSKYHNMTNVYDKESEIGRASCRDRVCQYV